MRIAYVSAGAAGMYCGSCLHDNTLAAALQRKGHDVALIPTYTPLRTDEEDVSLDQVFYGAINVFLEQKSALFRHTPRVVDRMLNRRGLLDWASRRGRSTDPRDLGAMTLSVLRGEDGNQKKELERLVSWLRDSLHPQIVHLTNSMFLGMVRRMKSELGVPVVCSVQGEDLFLDALHEPHRSDVLQELRRRAADADGFVATSRYYATYMREYLDVPEERMHVVKLGLRLHGHGQAVSAKSARPFTVGYLARLCPEKGLDLLVEAFHLLTEQVGRDRVRLRVAGYLGERDRPYVERVREQIRDWGLDDVVDFVGEVSREEKIEFLHGIDVLSVPTAYLEPKGLFVLEALANGVPVVQPDHGAFPELIEQTGGGILFESGSVEELSRALRRLMDDEPARAEMGRAGRESVHRSYSDEVMADETLRLYRGYVTAAGA